MSIFDGYVSSNVMARVNKQVGQQQTLAMSGYEAGERCIGGRIARS